LLSSLLEKCDGGNAPLQIFALCLLDYEFLILNNAFLVHVRRDTNDADYGDERKKIVDAQGRNSPIVAWTRFLTGQATN
jgi:hypothetical protein